MRIRDAGLWARQNAISLPIQAERAASGEASSTKNVDAARPRSIEDHSAGVAARLVSSRKTRIARSRYHGLAKR